MGVLIVFSNRDDDSLLLNGWAFRRLTEATLAHTADAKAAQVLDDAQAVGGVYMDQLKQPTSALLRSAMLAGATDLYRELAHSSEPIDRSFLSALSDLADRLRGDL